jgi:hypothetical protein
MAYEVGQCEGLYTRCFWLLWATSSSLGIPAYLHTGYRPIREFWSNETPFTAYYAGPSDTLVGQPIVFPMGQSELIV